MRSRKFTLKDYSSLALGMLLGNKVGDAQVIYTDVNPDIEIESGYLILDLDNNLVNEFKVVNYASFNATSSYLSCNSIVRLGIYNLNTENSIIGFDNTFGNDFIVPIDYSASITALADFNADSFQWLSLKKKRGDCNSYIPEPWNYFNLGGWNAILGEDKYIGVKFDSEESNCYYYGWIRCVISDSLEKITIKDFAYNATCGEGIKAGKVLSCAGPPMKIDPIITLQNSMLSIKVTSYYYGSQIHISNILGEKINTANISTNVTMLYLNNLAAGIYLVSIKNESDIFVYEIFLK